MKHIALLMAVVGLTFTGCAQSKVFGPLGNNLRTAMTKKSPAKQNIRSELNATQDNNNIQLAAFGGGGCTDACCGDDCCDDGCCSNGGCSDGSCSLGGRRGRNGGRNNSCSACGGRGCGLCARMRGAMAGCNPHAGGYPEPQNFNPSPPTGQVAYPYYTVRGPRDFLRNNPPTIGPY